MGISLANQNVGRYWGLAGAAQEDLSRSLDDALQAAVEALQPTPRSRILDIGCGTGRATRQLGEQVPGERVRGIDVSRELVKAARGFARIHGMPIRFEVGEAERLRFRRNEFDRVLSTFGVIFAQDPTAAAGEIIRVCRPGGRLVLTAWEPSRVLLDLRTAFNGGRPPTDAALPEYFRWADRQFVRDLFGPGFDLRFQSRETRLFAPDAEWIWNLWSRTTLQVSLALMSATERERTRRATLRLLNRFRAGPGVCLARRYLLISGVRRGSPSRA